MIQQESFYLCREYDLEKQRVFYPPVQYDSHFLTTLVLVVIPPTIRIEEIPRRGAAW